MAIPAQAADLQSKYSAMRQRGPSLYDPTWWIDHPVERAAVLAQCARRGPGDDLVFRYCWAAGQASLLAGRR